MKYKEIIKSQCQKSGNSICMGLDPLLNKIPLDSSPEENIKRFYLEILNELMKKNLLPAAVKPNMAFYEGISIDCLKVLAEIIKAYQSAGVLAVLDAKRGDIGKTSEAYAKMAFNVYGSDAVTVNPYMGLDSIAPFQKVSEKQGIYVLVRTSNPSATDFQSLKTQESDRPVYLEVAQKLCEWDDGNLGAVVGATSPGELEAILRFWKSQGKEFPCLIPGISLPGVSGGQGGNIQDVFKAIKNAGGDREYHLVNSSSGLSYAYEKYTGCKYFEATGNAMSDLLEAGEK